MRVMSGRLQSSMRPQQGRTGDTTAIHVYNEIHQHTEGKHMPNVAERLILLPVPNRAWMISELLRSVSASVGLHRRGRCVEGCKGPIDGP